MSGWAIMNGCSSIPRRRRMSPVLFSILRQGWLCTRVRQSCAEQRQPLLSTAQRTALVTAKGEDGAGWHQHMAPLACPPLQEGALLPLFWERERSHTHLPEWGRSQDHISQKEHVWLMPTKTQFLFFGRNGLVFKQLCKHNGGFTGEIEANESFASAF